MAVAQGYGKTVTSGSVFAYDTGDIVNCYVGEPTTNYAWKHNPRIDSSYTSYLPNAGSGTLTQNHPGAIRVYNQQGTDISNYQNGGVTDWTNQRHAYWVYDEILKKPVVRMYNQNGSWQAKYFVPDFTSLTSIGVTAGTQYTISWLQYVENLNRSANVGLYSNSSTTGTNNFWDGLKSAYNTKTHTWERVSATFTATNNGQLSNAHSVYMYGMSVGSGELRIADVQIEVKPYKTSFSNTLTRTPTQSLIPLVGNSTLDLSNVSFNSKAQMIFDGTNDDLKVQVSNSKTNITMEGVFYVNLGTTGTYLNNGNDSGGYCIGIGSFFNTQDNQITALFGGVRWILTGAYYEYTGYHHIVMTLDETSTPSIYVNGKLIGTYPGNPPNNVTPGTGFSIGSQWGIRYSNTICPVSKFYNRVLSANEIKQNYEFYNARLGNELDTYYFTVSNLAARYTHSTGKGYTMPTTTPAYILYKKPSEQSVGVYSYRELSYDFIGSPPRLTKYGTQTIYSGGKYFTDVTVRKKKKDGTLSFGFLNGGTSQYGENFYKSIITPHIPK